MTKYVLGFIFNEDVDRIMLLRKSRPEWQAGLLNAMGGKVEDGETPRFAICRIAEERVGANTKMDDWVAILNLMYTKAVVHVYALASDKVFHGAEEAAGSDTLTKLLVHKIRDEAPMPDIAALAELCRLRLEKEA